MDGFLDGSYLFIRNDFLITCFSNSGRYVRFTFVNSDLRNISSDKVTPNFLIIKKLRCHLSFVTFRFTPLFVLL